MSNTNRVSWAAYIVDAVLALLCVSQIASPVFHDLGYLAEIVVFVVVFVILQFGRRFAMQRGWGIYRRAGLTAGLFLGILVINIASAMQHCDRGHLNCRRVFSL